MVDISILVLLYAIIVIEYDKRRSGLPSAPPDERYDKHGMDREISHNSI